MSTPTPRLVILIGLQAAGKTSFCRTHLSECARVSKDDFPNARRPQARLEREVMAHFDAQGDAGAAAVVIDGTNPSRRERARLFALAATCGARVDGYYFRSVLDECLPRNALREGRARVARVALLATAKRFERPSLDEGFSRLYYVRLGEEGFAVSPWEEA